MLLLGSSTVLHAADAQQHDSKVQATACQLGCRPFETTTNLIAITGILGGRLQQQQGVQHWALQCSKADG
jgi:hypothetical protein